MDNFYLIQTVEKWAAVCIAKNACTSLKQVVLAHSGLQTNDLATIHNAIGYDSNSRFFHPVRSGKPVGLLSFAIWRDPISRLASIYRHFGLDGFQLDRLAHLKHQGFDAWVDYAAQEVKRPVLEQDEHLRRQCDYYSVDDVDVVVHLKNVSDFFRSKSWSALSRENQSIAEFEMTPAQAERVAEIYSDDLTLLKTAERKGKVWQPTTFSPSS